MAQEVAVTPERRQASLKGNGHVVDDSFLSFNRPQVEGKAG
jgi:hypothetical protein